jgi:hypothetical protein
MKKEKAKELLSKSNYSLFLGLQCDRPKNELQDELKDYEELSKIISSKLQNIKSKYCFIQSQIDSIKYALSNYEHIELSKTKPAIEHKKLLKEMCFIKNNNWGIQSLNTNDVAEILEWKLPNDDLSDEQTERALKLLKELPYVLGKYIKNFE